MFGMIVFSFLVFFFSSHPLVLGSILVGSTVLVCFYVFFVFNVGWFSYILFLVFLGGMLVLFIYVASLASNESLKFDGGYFLLVLLFFGFLGMWMFQNFSLGVWKFYFNFPLSVVVLFLGVYLLFSLVGVVKISGGGAFGPLREMVYEYSEVASRFENN
uniref:NADH dehydrogenase subunit 6 n=1 Tax=Lychas mucronatus TaxID=172552 RepID=UPI0023D8C8C7|nr:NADH dehydrogenase subunit 6 [Lychas mucronatus]WDA95775.1 NADH dehydrogenase subunit 6 [Lychas mucronatus]